MLVAFQGLPPELADWLLSTILAGGSQALSCSEFELFNACVTEVSLDASTNKFGHDWIRALGSFRLVVEGHQALCEVSQDGSMVVIAVVNLYF